MLYFLYNARGVDIKIAEVSKKFEISADTLRYYERVGLLPPVNRTINGIRDFDEIDEKGCGNGNLMSEIVKRIRKDYFRRVQ